MKNNSVIIPVSAAELIDKITILEIKSQRISDKPKLNNIRNELKVLKQIFTETIHKTSKVQALIKLLQQVNTKIWDTEDKIRLCEKNQNFGPSFVKVARLVYLNNDLRSDIKKKINLLIGSGIIEEKSYVEY